MMRAYLVDDEELALRRLARLLEDSRRAQVVGSSSDPERALREVGTLAPDVVFLDIEMPGMTGLEMASRMPPEPVVVFTTAYSQYALEAFERNAIDYLLKPVHADQLDRALRKAERIRGGTQIRPDLSELVERLRSALPQQADSYPERLPSRSGERVQFVDLARVSHIYAKDKLTFAAAPGKEYCLDWTITELESRLDPKKFVRVHRGTIVNLEQVDELHNWFGGKLLIRLRDSKRTEVTVSRDRAKAVRDRLGLK